MGERIYIYRVYFPESDKCYIGQTSDIERRMQVHLLNSKSLVGKALWKYDKWEWTILHTCYSKDEANRIEIEEIRNFGSRAPGGYNLTSGGEGGDTFTGRRHTEESRAKMSASHKGVKAPWVSKALKGKKLSPEHIEKLRQIWAGRKHTEETKKKMSESAKKRTRRPFSEEAKKNMGKHCKGLGNASHRTDVKIKRLQTRINRYLSELNLSPEQLSDIDKPKDLL